ncbi:MAG: SsrA-binding protein [Solirubrobacteraceae bacterium]|nr:SsrA-binding protein [Solirubrobacteraceae bacterium]
MAKAKKRKIGAGDVASNRQAAYRFELLDKLECGLVLFGTEVKSLRAGGAQLKDGYVNVSEGQLWLQNVHIPPYAPAAANNHEPERPRKLLAHRREIDRMKARVAERGLTIVPTRIYFKDGRAKVEIALGRGKDQFDKRQTLKAKEERRDVDRALRDAQR